MGKIIGSNDVKLSQQEQEHLDALKQKAKQRFENRSRVLKQELDMRRVNREAHVNMIRQVFSKADLDFDELENEIEHRHKILHKMLGKQNEKMKEIFLAQLKQEMHDMRKVEIAYRNKFKDDLIALQGNPGLKFYQAAHMDYRVLAAPYGVEDAWSGNPPEWRDNSDWRIDMRDPRESQELNWHAFYPQLYINNGSFRDQLTLEVELSITFRHPPLESERGNFLVDYIKVNLSGGGYFSATDLDTCPFFLQSHGLPTAGETTMDIIIFQSTPVALQGTLIDNHHLWSAPFGPSEAFTIDLRTNRFDSSFFLAGPDTGGESILLTINFRAYIKSSDERRGVSQLDMNKDIGGLILECIELYGEYTG